MEILTLTPERETLNSDGRVLTITRNEKIVPMQMQYEIRLGLVPSIYVVILCVIMKQQELKHRLKTICYNVNIYWKSIL